MWLLAALIPSMGVFVGMFIFLFSSVVRENLENVIRNDTSGYAKSVNQYF